MHSNTLLKKFIEEYQSLPELWDARHKNYTDKNARNAALDKLLAIYVGIKSDATHEDVRKKINILRSNFRKDLNRIQKSKQSGEGVIYKPLSWKFKALQFLTKGQNDKKGRVEKISKEQICKKQAVKYLKTIENFKRNQKDLIIPKTVETKKLFVPKKKVTLKESIIPNIEDTQKHVLLPKKKVTQKELLAKACYLLTKSTKVNAETPQLDPLALLWTQKLQKLHPHQKIFAEKAIHDILLEAELHQLHRNSVQINNFNLANSSYVSSHFAQRSPLDASSSEQHNNDDVLQITQIKSEAEDVF